MMMAQFLLVFVPAVLGLWLLATDWDLLALVSFGMGGLVLTVMALSYPSQD
jgi:hypothetical protein